MKRSYWIYIPIAALFVFSATALVLHFATLDRFAEKTARQADLPFSYLNDRAYRVSPEAAAAGIREGDQLVAINGREVGNGDIVLEKELNALKRDEPVTLVMARGGPKDGPRETYTAIVSPRPIEHDLSRYATIVTAFIFSYLLPTVSALLGFWVLFVRPRDPLAWVLLFVLMGTSSVAFEVYWQKGTILKAYRDLYFGTWAMAMLLFGIYFPERWSIDKRFPWAKWLLLGPLCFQLLLTLLSILNDLAGISLFWLVAPLARFYAKIGFIVNLVAISLFFSALSHKAGTTKNPDARRRLYVMLFGTSLAITPSFLIVLYKFATGKMGSFLEVVPVWIALAALLLLLLFPLTMAYVIVVYRAMDVRVVIRQGLQYALARGGVRAIQLILLLAIGLVVRWVINNYGVSLTVQLLIIAGGVALVPLVEYAAKPLRLWIDRRFFREAYDAEQILTELTDKVRTMVETQPLLETVASTISTSLHVPQVAMLVKTNSHFEPAYSVGFDTQPAVALPERSRAMDKLASNRYIQLFEDQTEVTSVPTVNRDEREQLTELNSQLLLPMASKNELAGIISLSAKRSEEPYSPSDLRLLRSVAAQTGLALENSRLTAAVAAEAAARERINRELEIAREVQERLFPQDIPNVPGTDIFGGCRPALGVGGDYYDYLDLPGGKIGVAIGDVSGKGIGAALMMASLQASLRGQAIHYKDDLAGLLKQVNELVYEASTSNRYATFFYSQYDPATKHLTYVNAGHNPPFLLRSGGELVRLEEGGAVVGMLPGMLVNYSQGEIDLRPGDLLVGFTDGISEAMNPSEDEWGEEALLEELQRIRDLPASEIFEKLIAAADAFAAGAKQHDDMTIIVMKIA